MLSCSKGQPHRFPLPSHVKKGALERGTGGERGSGEERGTGEGAGGGSAGGGTCVKCSRESEEEGRCVLCGFLFCLSCVKLARFFFFFPP